LDTTAIRVRPRNFRNSCSFTATCKISPSARCVSAANRVCKDIDIIWKPIISVKQVSAIFKSTYLFFQDIGVLPQYFFYIVFSAILFLFFLFSVLFLCICTAFVFYLCLCDGFIIDTCSIKLAH
jgi:small-conductance mechanosensitive channel